MNSEILSTQILVEKHLVHVLRLVAQVDQQENFAAAAQALCRELSVRFGCENVCLGWAENGSVKLQSVSRLDGLDQKMQAAFSIELVMEEALDQDCEIIWPDEDSHSLVTRDHEAYAKAQGAHHLLSMPLRSEGQAVAVCLLERQEMSFSETQTRLIRFILNQLTRRLVELKHRDLSLWQRSRLWARKKIKSWAGYEHTARKAALISAALVLAIFCFVPVSYRLYSPAILRTPGMAYLTAPFDGVVVEGAWSENLGENVHQGELLLRLARTDGIFVELEVPESEIHRLEEGMEGQVSLASRPEEKFPIKIFSFEPAAVVRKDGNVFLAHCRFVGAPPVWARPGMSGRSKIIIGKKTLLWIVSHHAIDFLRLHLWW